MNQYILRNIPNGLSISRIILSIIFSYILYIFLLNNYSLMLPLFIFMIIILSDRLDGYIARKTSNATQLGAILDVMSDVIFMILSYVTLILLGYLSLWFLVFGILFFVEFIITSKYMEKYSKKEVKITYDTLGKYTGILCIILPGLVILMKILIPSLTIIFIQIITYFLLICGIISAIYRIRYCYNLH